MKVERSVVESEPCKDDTQLKNDIQKSDNECVKKEDQYQHEIHKKFDVKVKNDEINLLKESEKIPNQIKNPKNHNFKKDQNKVYKTDKGPKDVGSKPFFYKDTQKSYKNSFVSTQNDNSYNGSLKDQNMQNSDYQNQINSQTGNNNSLYHQNYDYTNQTDYRNYGDGSNNLYAQAGSYANYDSMYNAPYYQKDQKNSQDYYYNYAQQDKQLVTSHNYCNNSYQNYNNNDHSNYEQYYNYGYQNLSIKPTTDSNDYKYGSEGHKHLIKEQENYTRDSSTLQKKEFTQKIGQNGISTSPKWK